MSVLNNLQGLICHKTQSNTKTKLCRGILIKGIHVWSYLGKILWTIFKREELGPKNKDIKDDGLFWFYGISTDVGY